MRNKILGSENSSNINKLKGEINGVKNEINKLNSEIKKDTREIVNININNVTNNFVSLKDLTKNEFKELRIQFQTLDPSLNYTVEGNIEIYSEGSSIVTDISYISNDNDINLDDEIPFELELYMHYSETKIQNDFKSIKLDRYTTTIKDFNSNIRVLFNFNEKLNSNIKYIFFTFNLNSNKYRYKSDSNQLTSINNYIIKSN